MSVKLKNSVSALVVEPAKLALAMPDKSAMTSVLYREDFMVS